MSGSAVDSAGGSAVTRKGREKKVEQKENVVEAAANVGNAPTNELTIAGCSSEFVTSLLCYCWTGQYFWVDSICTIEESTNLESAGICRVFRGYSMYRRGMLDEALVLLDPFCLEEDAKAGDGFALPIASVICLVHAAKDSDKSTAASSKATLKTLFKASADVPTFVSACLYLADEDIPKSKALIEKLLAADQTNVAFLGLFGWLNLLLANGPKALQCFTKALKINAKDPLVLYGLAVQRDRYEDAHKALQAATKLLQIYRESSVALEERTRLLLLTGQLSQAFATAKKASKICGESWVGYRCLFLQALITETPEDPARAFKVLKKLLKIVEQNGSENSPHVRTQSLKVMELALSLSPMYSINTANILKLGDAVLRRCLKVDADDIPALVVYGRLLLKTGLDTKLLQAIKMFTRARSLLPGELEKEVSIFSFL
jgi:tetratricopeptide (TPR) repeat protein